MEIEISVSSKFDCDSKFATGIVFGRALLMNDVGCSELFRSLSYQNTVEKITK
jgi:hypothetical protein